MTIIHIPTPAAKTDFDRYVELASEYAKMHRDMALFALAAIKRSEENGDTYLAEGAARLLFRYVKEKT